ncbi:hypothetical protein RB195_012746 [Necator americanus]|uniref:Uncharacterized protein n=1 Tax=Necator americanus TaxID=51031 RepID=A0ABR1DSC1_NECAM
MQRHRDVRTEASARGSNNASGPRNSPETGVNADYQNVTPSYHPSTSVEIWLHFLPFFVFTTYSDILLL